MFEKTGPGETSTRSQRVSAALEAVVSGDQDAMNELFTAVYDELRQLAHQQRRRWTGNETLDTTALVHESYFRLIDRTRFELADLRHFFAVAATAMRHILIDYAKGQNAAKRGGRTPAVDLEIVDAATQAQQETLVGLSNGLTELAQIDERQARVFEYRFFLGLSVAETAELLDISKATVKRDWTLATSFLRVYVDSE